MLTARLTPAICDTRALAAGYLHIALCGPHGAICKYTAALDADARALYPKFTKSDVIALLYAKWFPELSARLGDLYKNVAHRFAASLSELVDRSANTLEECQSEVDALEARVKQHLSDMGI